MIYFKNKHQHGQGFAEGDDSEQQIHVSLIPILKMECETMMIRNLLSGENVEDAKKLTIEAFRQRCNIPKNCGYKGPDCMKSGILETVERSCDQLPEKWRQTVAQLRGEEEFTAEGIRQILATLTDRNHGIAWLYIFKAVGLEATFQVFRMSDNILQKVLADVKRFLRLFFLRLVDTTNREDPDEAIRLLLRRILNEAIETNVKFRVESREVLKDIFAWVAADTRSKSPIEQKTDGMSTGIIALQKAMRPDGA